jgi:hypothetical protein
MKKIGRQKRQGKDQQSLTNRTFQQVAAVWTYGLRRQRFDDGLV